MAVSQEPEPTRPGARKPFLLRLPPDLMAELKGWAAQELRSLNGHIEYLLRKAAKERKGPTDESRGRSRTP